MTNSDDKLLKELARRNWVVLAILLLLSLLWKSREVTLGVLSGGLVAIGGFYWLQDSLRKTLANPTSFSARGFQISYFVRLGAISTALLVLIVLVKINPIAMACGLSVVVVNIFITTLKRLLLARRTK